MKLLGGNGNVLEGIRAPIQVFDTDDLVALRGLATGAASKRFHRHYAGFFRGICREHQKSDAPTAKGLLYSYRVALTGIHYLRTGESCAHLPTLVEKYGFTEALDLITLKAAQGEKDPVPKSLDGDHRANWPRLEAELTEALRISTLPEVAENTHACSDWLVQRRLAQLEELTTNT